VDRAATRAFRARGSPFNGLVIDKQRLERLVPKGSTALRRHIGFVRTEAADFGSYAGGCPLAELRALLGEPVFARTRRHRVANCPGLDADHDVAYQHRSAAAQRPCLRLRPPSHRSRLAGCGA
jgi:hypothetical protein